MNGACNVPQLLPGAADPLAYVAFGKNGTLLFSIPAEALEASLVVGEV